MSGVVFTPAAADRIGRAVRWVESRRQAGDSPVGPARGVEPVWVRLTSGTADGDGHYPGVITLYSGVGEAWSDYSAVKVAPLNGETLANATRYAVRPSGRTPAGDELYTVIGATVAAGTIAVEAADGTPAYAGVTKVTFDQADGFSLSEPLSGVVEVDMVPATESQAGIVSTAAQTFGGRKSFPDGTITGDIAVVCSTDANGYYGVVGGAYCVSTWRQASANYDLAISGLLSGSNVWGHTDQLSDGIYDTNDYNLGIEYRRDLSEGGDGLKMTVFGAGMTLELDVDLIRVSEPGGAPEDTATGYLVDGTRVANGMIVEIGDGSALDEASQDAVGGILETTDTVTLTYTDSPAAITAVVNLQGSLTSDAGGLKLSGDSATPGNSKLYGTDSSGVKGWYDRPSGDIDGGTW